MSERAEALANELQRSIDDVDQFIDEVSPEGWQAMCPGEQCTVAALICHIGNSNTGMLDSIVKPVAEGTPRPNYTAEEINHWNAEGARRYAAASKEQARELLRSQAAAAVTYVRQLSDEQLDRPVQLALMPTPLPLADTISLAMAGHPREHLASARAAAGMTD